jgi:hypothetical protein
MKDLRKKNYMEKITYLPGTPFELVVLSKLSFPP